VREDFPRPPIEYLLVEWHVCLGEEQAGQRGHEDKEELLRELQKLNYPLSLVIIYWCSRC
jgi:hypothetical protein